MSCSDLETVAAWCLGELLAPEEECFEAHYFSCESCFRQTERMQRLIAQLRGSLPAILTVARRQSLEQGQPRLRVARLQAGERATLQLSEAAPLGLWLMQARLEHVTRVDFEARSSEGALLFALSDVPFDVGRGEVVLACQVHYRALAMPSEIHVRLTATSPSGRHALADYILDHEFESL